MSLKIDGTDFKTPTSFNIERYNLTKSGRVASGKMTMDIIAQKHKFNLEYSVISGDELEHIFSLIFNPNKPFFDFTYVENGATKTKRCYVGAIPAELVRADIWRWVDVKFSLIEQ